MLKPLLTVAALTIPQVCSAQTQTDLIADIIEGHVLPAYATLVSETEALVTVSEAHCQPDDPELISAFGAAFDAWISVSHIGFGPAETDGRLFALAFWPDTRGITGRSLTGLIADLDPVVEDQEDYATVSVAARGFYALEFLLFDPTLSAQGDRDYRCALVQAITADIAITSATIHDEWDQEFAELMLTAGENERFQSADEAVRTLFGALSSGLEFTIDLRLGRPLGTFDAPRPTRAEVRRSGRSTRHVELSLLALSDLADRLAQDDPDLRQTLAAAFGAAIDRAQTLEDPSFAGVADPISRIRVEALQSLIREAQSLVQSELGPTLGVAAGFNSLDGD